MTDMSSAAIAGIGALSEPARAALYRFVAAQPEPVGREQAAAAVGIAVHSAKFHLDRLVREGLLEVEFRRLSGRTGPGAGRPAKLYRRSAAQFSVSLPERRYDLAGRILASGVDRSVREGVPVVGAVHAVALETGRAAGEDGPRDKPEPERTTEVLAAHGYEPRVDDDEIALANCPFDALAREHTELVCGINEVFVEGVLEGLACSSLRARLEPHPTMCCVRIRARGED